MVLQALTGEETTVNLYQVCIGLKVAGKMVMEEKTGVRYFYTKILNEGNQYSGVTFSMYYEIVYSDGHVIRSNPTSVEVK